MTAPSSQTFRTELWAAGGKNVAIVVPADVLARFERGKRVPVVVTIDGGHQFRNTIASMGGRFLISFNAATRAATGRGAGDAVEVRLDVDDGPRTVEVPAELAAALDADPAAKAAWDKLSYSAPARARRVDHRREDRGDPGQAGRQGARRRPQLAALTFDVLRCVLAAEGGRPLRLRPRSQATNSGSSMALRRASAPIGTRWETIPAAV